MTLKLIFSLLIISGILVFSYNNCGSGFQISMDQVSLSSDTPVGPTPAPPHFIDLVIETPRNPNATATSTAPNSVVTNAFDVDPVTFWAPATAAAQSLRFDLGADLEISRVELNLSISALTQASVRIFGRRAEAETQIVSVQKQVRDLEILELSFSPATYRELRIEIQSQGPVLGIREVEVFERLPISKVNIPKYFSYWGVDFDGAILSPETLSHSNMTWIRSDEVNRLNLARQNRLKVLLDVMNVFFTLDGVNPLTHNADYQTRWQQYVAAVSPYRDIIEAFQILDEPISHILILGIPASEKSTRIAATRAYISNTIIPLIRRDFPGKAIIFTAGPLEMFPHEVISAPGYPYPNLEIPDDYQPQVPAGADWVATYCYGGWYNCDGVSIPTYLQTLKQIKTPQQKIYFIPQSAVLNRAANSLDELLFRAKSHRYFARSLRDPEVVAVFPWTYRTIPNLSVGAQSLPVVREAYQKVGDFIKRNNL